MNSRHTLSLMTPASWHGDMWREGLPCGNGIIGAMVYGNIADETLMINHCGLRHWGKKTPLPDISDSLQETRRLMDEGRYTEANGVSSNRLKDKGYEGKLYTPCPLCDIKIQRDPAVSFNHYKRTLAMESGEITVSWNEEKESFKRRTFVSRTEDVLVARMDGTCPFSLKLFLQLHETFAPDTQRMREECQGSLETFIKGDCLYYAATNDDGTDFGGVVRVITDGGMSIEEERVLCIHNASDLTLLADFFIKEQRKEAFERLTHKLKSLNKTYEALMEAHAAEHGRLYRSCDIQLDGRGEDGGSVNETDTGHNGTKEYYNEEILLNVYKEEFPNELFERLWRFGRYLMISGTRNLPFPLYGLWGGRYNLMWSHNMANENLQMMYWHTLNGGLSYTVKPVIEYYFELLEDFKENARKLFGLPGIYVPAGSSPGMGMPNQIVPVIMNWIGAAGWLCQHFYQYYLYTGDQKLLEEKILPFMENALAFYEAYLVLDSNGYYKIYPSVSPENSPGNFFTQPAHERVPHVCPTAVNATMDLAIIKELITNMLDVSERLGIYKDKTQKWEEILRCFPTYKTNEEGAIREWQSKEFLDRYNHRHISHIYPVFPGTEYIVGRDDEAMLKAFEEAVNKRILGSQTGWSFSHMASIYARFEKGDKALDCLKNLIKGCLLKNFMTLHNDWRRMGLTMNLGDGNTAPMQLDANMGIVNALQEMLLFVSKDLIKLLPACPEQFNRGSVSGLRYCTGEISFSWDKARKAFEGEMRAARETRLSLLLPDMGEEYELYFTGTGQKIRVSGKEAVLIELKSQSGLVIKSI